MTGKEGKKILLLEPFYGGSHKQLIDLIESNFINECEKFCMSDKKWHWRMRASSLHFSNVIPREHDYRLVYHVGLSPVNFVILIYLIK